MSVGQINTLSMPVLVIFKYYWILGKESLTARNSFSELFGQCQVDIYVPHMRYDMPSIASIGKQVIQERLLDLRITVDLVRQNLFF